MLLCGMVVKALLGILSIILKCGIQSFLQGLQHITAEYEEGTKVPYCIVRAMPESGTYCTLINYSPEVYSHYIVSLQGDTIQCTYMVQAHCSLQVGWVGGGWV